MRTKVYITIISLFFTTQLWAQQDVGINSIIAPTSGCSVGLASNPINVIVRNFSGSTAFSNTITVRYRINSGPIIAELITTNLGPNASFNFTFFQTANLQACGNYQIKVWTQKFGDPNALNDTLNYLFINDCPPIPGVISGPSLLCDNVNSDSLTVTGGTFNYGYQWHQQIIPGSFNPTGIITNKFYLNNMTDSSAYFVRYDGGLCPNVNSAIFGVGISPNIDTGVVSPNLVLCEDDVVGNISVSGFTSSISNWEQSNNGGLTWIPLAITSSTLNIDYLADSAIFRANISSGVCGSKYSDTISVDINYLITPGSISGATTVCSGINSTTLTVSGQQNNFGFEWYSSTDNITFNPTTVTTSSYVQTNLTQTTYYKVIMFGVACDNVETPVVAIIVDPQVNTGTNSPNLTLCESNVTGSVGVAGFTSVLSNWEQSNDNGATWLSLGNSNNPLDISFLTSSALFRAEIQSGVCGSAYTNPISVTIEDLIVPGSISGLNVACNVSNLDTLALVGSSNNLSQLWFSSVDSVVFNSTLVSNDTLLTNNINQTTYYYVVLSGNVCPPDTTATFTFTIAPVLNLGIPSADIILCSNNVNGNISLSGFTSTIVDWEQSNNGGATWFSTGINSSTLNVASLTASASFRALIQSGVCGSGYSDTIDVTINPVVIPGSISSGANLCFGVNTDTLILTGNANDFGFQWYSSTDNVTFTPTGIVNDTFIVNNLTQTTFYKVILTGIGCPNVETNVSSFVVDPSLNVGTVSPDLNLCATSVTGFVSISAFSNTILDWEQSNDGGLTWISTGITSSSLNISFLSTSADFRALIGAGACGTGYSDTISVTIQDPIVPGILSFNGTTVCAGSNADTLVLAGYANDSGFEWFSSTDNIIFLPTGITNDSLITPNISQTTYYKVILQGDFCPDSETSVLTVQIDQPINLGVVSADLNLCASSIVGTVGISGFTSTISDWEQSNDGGLTWNSTGVSTPTVNISFLTSSSLFRAVVSSGTCGTGISDTVEVTIQNPIVPGTISFGGVAVCSGTNADTLVLIGNSNDSGYEWFSSTDNISFTATGITVDTLITPSISQSTFYKVVLQGDNCPNAETSTIVVQINPPLNFGVVSADLELCSTSIAGNVGISGFTSTLVDWEQSNDGGATWFSTGITTPTFSISFLTASASFRALIASGACGTGYSDTVEVAIQNAIVPGAISFNGVPICSGVNSDTLVLVGNSNFIGFEWYFSLDNVNFTPTGITDDTLITPGITQSTFYKVILQGDFCPNAETASILEQIDPPLNLGVVTSNLQLCSSSISGTVGISGFTTTLVDWEQSNDGGLTWISTGISTPTLDISFLTASAFFRAVISSGACGTGFSDTIEVTIQNAVVPGSIAFSGLAICSGSNADTLALIGNANSSSFEWYTSLDNINFVPTGITNDTLVTANITQSTYFQVLLLGTPYCPSALTSTILIQVDSVLNLGTTSPDLLLCSTSIVGTITLSNFLTTIVEWEQSNDGGLTWNPTGISTSTIDISYLTATASFRAAVNSGACGAGISDTITVTIDSPIIPGSISGTDSLCAGTNTDTLVLSGFANQTNFEWFSSIDNINYTPTGISSDTLILSNLTQSIYYKVILTGNVCANDETNPFLIHVDPPLDLGILSPDLFLCSSNIAGAITLSNFTAILEDWEQSDNGGATWNSTGINTPSLDISFLTASALFRAVVSSGACGTGISDTAIVVIENEIVAGSISGNTPVCFGSLSDTLILSGNLNQVSSEWFTTTSSPFLPTGITSDTLILSNLTQTTSIYVQHFGNFCPDVQTPLFTLQVDPAVTQGTPSSDLSLCVNDITGTISITNFSTTFMDWEQSNNGGLNWFSIGTNNPVLDISFLSASAQFRAVISSGVCGTILSDTISVTVDPLGIPASIGFDFVTCIGSPDLDSMKIFSHTGSILGWHSSVNNGSTWSNIGVVDTILYVNLLPATTIYSVITTHGACPNDTSNIITGTANPIPLVSAGVDTTIAEFSSVQLSGSGGAFGIWSPSDYLSDPTLPSPNSTPLETITYAYSVIDINGCINTDFVTVTVLPDSTGLPFVIYNIITPNGDGLNDFFNIKGLNTLSNYRIKIFNANGNLIFSSRNYNNDWDATYKGKIVPDGTYLYALEVDNVTKYRGFLTIMKGND